MSIREILTKAPIVPVLRIEKVEDAVPLARALVAGGLPVLEVTLRTSVAFEAMERMVAEVPDAIIGAGTVTRPEELRLAERLGLRFTVSPGLTDALAKASVDVSVPHLPGVMTPSEVMGAREAGFTALKLFPAKQAGGLGMLKALAGPFPEVVFCPTGGVSVDTAPAFLALKNVVCVGGSWIAPDAAVRQGDWGAVTRLAREALDLIAAAGSGGASPTSAKPASALEAGDLSSVGEEDPGSAAEEVGSS